MTLQEERAHMELSLASLQGGARVHRGPSGGDKEDITARWIAEDEQALAGLDRVIGRFG